MSVIQNFAKSSRLPPNPPPLGHTLNPSRYTAFLPFLGPSKVEENFRHAYSIPTRLTKLKPAFFLDEGDLGTRLSRSGRERT